MIHVRKFSEKVFAKLVQFHNSIPNIPIALHKRVPHGRNDVLFTFSHRFHGVQALIGSDGPIEYQLSPEFADQFSKSKWSLRVYFRGDSEEVRDKYASCFLQRTTKGSAKEERRTFGTQIFMDFGNDSDESKPKVYSRSEVENRQSHTGIGVLGYSRFAPLAAFSGKNTVTVGVLFYYRSSDSN